MANKTETKKPRVSVLERRLQNPFGEPSVEVVLKDKSVKPRWFNDDVKNGQIYRATQLGWQYVTPDMIADMDSLGFHTVQNDRITRGPRGQEVLMWMPDDDYWIVQAAKTRKNLQDMKDFDREKHNALNAFASERGGTAAQFASDRLTPIGGVKTSYERVQRVDGTE